MFTRSARFYDALYSWKDYPGETAKLRAIIHERRPDARTLLDVACGTGKHLELLREVFEVEGVDINPEFVAIARDRLPGVSVHEGDMLSFDLGRTFDVVTCLFSSIAYAKTPKDLGRAIATMAGHVKAGGVLIIEPFFESHQWELGHLAALFVDEPDLKIARMNQADRDGDLAVMDFHYLVASADRIEHFTERHEAALFSKDEYLKAFGAAGLEPEHDSEGLMGRGLYIAVKPG
ncbi:MAG: class I SAM-dependent methyltransferase [Actinomycetota bacterium]